MLADLHLHTHYSVDSTDTMDAYCRQALSSGVEILCFTDHADFHPKEACYQYYRAEEYFAELQTVRERYADRLQIFAGVELSEPHLHRREAEAFHKRPYDFILASVHLWYHDLFLLEIQEQRIPIEDCYEAYWHQLRQLAAYGGFDALAHLDFPKRIYGTLHHQPEVLAELLSSVVRQGKIVEINTSLFRQGGRETMPGATLLDAYRNCGGTQVTFGSDAHRAVDLAAQFDIAADLAQAHGLEPVYFVRHHPCVILENSDR